MLIRTPGRVEAEARAKAEPADDLLTRDYYNLLPQIRVTAEAGGAAVPASATEIVLDGPDVTRLVECALRHPSANMRLAVVTAIWNHPETFRQLFEFGLDPPPTFADIRKLVAEALAKRALAAEAPGGSGSGTLLPPTPPPPHLRTGKKT